MMSFLLFILCAIGFLSIVFATKRVAHMVLNFKPKHGTAIKEDMGKSKYQLIVKEGTYESDSMFSLFITVMQHRTWHLFNEGKWKD